MDKRLWSLVRCWNESWKIDWLITPKTQARLWSKDGWKGWKGSLLSIYDNHVDRSKVGRTTNHWFVDANASWRPQGGPLYITLTFERKVPTYLTPDAKTWCNDKYRVLVKGAYFYFTDNYFVESRCRVVIIDPDHDSWALTREKQAARG